MTPTVSREIHLASRPVGRPTPDNFSLAQVTINPPKQDQVLVRNLFMSVAPSVRGRLTDSGASSRPFALGQPLDGHAIGEVVESRSSAFKPGDAVISRFGWREYYVVSASELSPVSREFEPLSLYLGALGNPGLTAWAGWQLIGINAGETAFVGSAAGAVGHLAGQLAKIYGCRVVGSAGSAAKVKMLREDCGFDAAFNYKDGATRDLLKAAAPDGIDAYFDLVGGETLDAAILSMRQHGRIIACGSLSSFDETQPQRDPHNLSRFSAKRLTMKGLVSADWMPRQAEFEREMGGYLRAGTVKPKETVAHGIDQAVGAFLSLFNGTSVGKVVVKLG